MHNEHIFDQDTALFNLSIDPVTKTHLGEAAKWARFLAIVGMAFLALMVLFFFVGGAAAFQLLSGMQQSSTVSMTDAGAGMVFTAVWLIMIVALYFFPLLYTLRFANLMRRALRSNDQDALNASFKNLKVTLRFLGIVTIVFLVIFALIVVIGLATVAMVTHKG